MRKQVEAAKRELNFYSEVLEGIVILKGQIQDELLPIDIDDDRADKLAKAIDLLEEFTKECGGSIEAHIDDLQNEEL